MSFCKGVWSSPAGHVPAQCPLTKVTTHSYLWIWNLLIPSLKIPNDWGQGEKQHLWGHVGRRHADQHRYYSIARRKGLCEHVSVVLLFIPVGTSLLTGVADPPLWGLFFKAKDSLEHHRGSPTQNCTWAGSAHHENPEAGWGSEPPRKSTRAADDLWGGQSFLFSTPFTYFLEEAPTRSSVSQRGQEAKPFHHRDFKYQYAQDRRHTNTHTPHENGRKKATGGGGGPPSVFLPGN